MSPFRSQDFRKGVIIVSSCRVHGNSSWFVDNNQAFVFVNNPNRLGCYGRFVPVEGMADYISILDNCLRRWDGFAVQVDCSRCDCALLGALVKTSLIKRLCGYSSTYIVLSRPIPKLILENLQYLPASPSLFAIRVISEMIGCNSSQSQFLIQFIGSRPGITGSRDDCGRWSEYFGRFGGRVDGGEGHV